jgi:hypothetical protein
LSLYNEYIVIIGLIINKTMALYINTPAPPSEHLQLLSMKPPDNVKHLKLQLGKTIESTVEATLAQTEPKLVKGRILATTPPMDVLHRAALINTAPFPVYNHASMAHFA